MADVSYPSFLSTLSPEQQAAIAQTQAAYARRRAPPPVASAAPPPPQDNGVLTDIGHGLAGGFMVDLPTMAGQAVKAFSSQDSQAYREGQSWQSQAEERGKESLYQTTGAWGSGARSVGALAPLLALSAIPGVGEALTTGASAALFGGSGYQSEKEKVLAAGGSEETAQHAGLAEGALQGIAQTGGALVAGRLVRGAGGVLAQKLMGKAAADGVLKEFANPTTHVVRNTAEALGIQLPLQAGVAAGSAAIDQAAGVGNETPWEAAKASFAPTAAMTALLAPIGVLGARSRKQQMAYDGKVVQGDGILLPNATPDQQADLATERMKAARRIASEMSKYDKAASNKWWDNASQAILNHEPVALDADFDVKAAREQRAAEQQQAAVDQTPLTPINEPMVESAQPSIDVTNPVADQTAAVVEQQRAGQEADARVNEPIPEKGGRGAQLTPDEVAARLIAAKNEEAPGQGTARLLGLPVDKAVEPAVGIFGEKQDTMESRVKALREHGLSGAPKDVRDRLLGLDDPKDVPEMLRAIWSEKGGEGADAKYVAKLGELYTKLTGKDIAEVKSYEEPTRSKPGEAAPENAKGAEPQPAAVQASTEVASGTGKVDEAQGNGGTVAGEQDRNAPQKSGAEVVDLNKFRSADKALQQEFDSLISEAKDQMNHGQLTPDAFKAFTDKQHGSQHEMARALDKLLRPMRGKEGAANENLTPQELANQFSGDLNALANGKEERGTQHQGAEGQRNEASVAEADRRNSGVGGTKEAQARARSGPGEDVAYSKELRGKIKELQAQHDASMESLKALQSKNPTKEQFARKARLETAVGDLKLKIQQLTEENTRVDRDIEKAKDLPEPTDTPNYYQFLNKPLDPEQGLTQPGRQNTRGEEVGGGEHSGNAIRLRSYLEALHFAGRASPTERALLGTMGSFRPGSRSRRAAEKALDILTPTQHLAYKTLVARYQNVLDVSRDMAAVAKKESDKVARSASEHMMDEAEFNERFEAIAQNKENGHIDAKTAYEQEIALMNEHWKQHGRDLDGVNAPTMAAQVVLDKSGQGMLEHLAATHQNPLTRAIASLLKATGVNPEIEHVVNPDFDGGKYQLRTNKILIGRGGMNPVTMLHEMWHAATQAAITRAQLTLAHLDNGVRSEANLSPRERKEVEALRTVQEVMDKFQSIADTPSLAQMYALTDIHEFVAEANSNPELQAKLGGARNWLSRIRQKFADAFGFSKDQQTDFEKLLRASTDLFGNPNTTMTDRIFNRPFGKDETPDMNHPYDAARMQNHAMNQLSTVGDRLARAWNGDWKQTLDKNLLSYTTLNHHEQIMKRYLLIAQDHLKAVPGAKEALDKIANHFFDYRKTVQLRKAIVNMMINGEGEGNAHHAKMFAFDEAHPMEAKRRDQVLRDMAKSEAPAWARSLKEAKEGDPRDPLKRGNPDVTQEMFDHAVAKSAREGWKKLTPDAQKLGLDQLAMNRMLHSRDAMVRVQQFLKVYDVHEASAKMKTAYNGLEPFANRTDEQGTVRSHLDQETRNVQSLKDARAALDEIADNDQHPRHDDADAVRTNVSALMKQWQSEHNAPYVHLGRQGPYFIRANVGGAQPEWDRVGRVVKDLQQEGRDWHDAPINDNRRLFMRFENKWDHKQAMDALEPMRSEGVFHTVDEDGVKKDAFEAGSLEDKQRSLTGATPKFIHDLVARLDKNPNMTADQKQTNRQVIYDSWLQMQSETSPLKPRMSADNTTGSMTSTTQASIERHTAHIQSIAGIKAAMGFTDALSGLSKGRDMLNKVGGTQVDPYRTKISTILDELNARAGDMQKIDGYNPVINQVKSITAIWDLALSPAYMMMVGYQPWQISVPEIAKKYGYGSTMLSMAKNTATAWGIIRAATKMGWGSSQGNTVFDKLSQISDVTIQANNLVKKGGEPLLDQHQMKMVNDLLGSGLVNMGMANQLYRIGPNERSTFNKAQRIAQLIPHAIEVSNRIATALTAHEMARTKGGMEHEAASTYALETIRNTDGDHSQANIARKLGQRGVLKQYTPLFVGFGQYDLQMTEFLGRTMHSLLSADSSKTERIESAKALAGIATSTSIIAGTLGLPFAGIAVGLYNAAKQLLQDEGDTPPDAENSWRQMMSGIFGEKGGEIVSRGVPRALNFDMSGRSGYQDLFPFTSFLTDRSKMEDRFANGMTAFMGPSMGIASGLAIGAQEAWHGNYPKAINNALPAFMRNAAKAYRLNEYGEESTSGANTQIPLDPPSSWDVVMRGMGFTSSPKAEYTEKNFAWRQEQEILQARHQVIMNEMMRAVAHNDNEALQRSFQRAIKFAMAQPQMRNFDLAGAVREQLTGQALGGLPGMSGVMVKKGQLPYYQQFTGGGDLPTYQ